MSSGSNSCKWSASLCPMMVMLRVMWIQKFEQKGGKFPSGTVLMGLNIHQPLDYTKMMQCIKHFKWMIRHISFWVIISPKIFEPIVSHTIKNLMERSWGLSTNVLDELNGTTRLLNYKKLKHLYQWEFLPKRIQVFFKKKNILKIINSAWQKKVIR